MWSNFPVEVHQRITAATNIQLGTELRVHRYQKGAWGPCREFMSFGHSQIKGMILNPLCHLVVEVAGYVSTTIEWPRIWIRTCGEFSTSLGPAGYEVRKELQGLASLFFYPFAGHPLYIFCVFLFFNIYIYICMYFLHAYQKS